MCKFDGVLLATDFDGTLYYDGKISDENLRAIKYFTDNGGKFTVCSGRYYEFLKKFSSMFDINTYTISYNGAYIIDAKNNEVLHSGFCDGYLFDIIDYLLENGLPYQYISFYTNDLTEPVSYSVEDYKNSKYDLMKKNIYKILLRSDSPENSLIGVSKINEFDLKDYIAVRSWDISLEIMKRENAKGAAIRRVADKLGSRLVVAVGDYENDIEMIKAADVGYAVENACDALKAVADRITCHANNSAIAKVIEEIERQIS